MLRTQVVSQLSAEPDAFQGRWRELASSCSYATVFQTPEWLASWWNNLGKHTPFRSLYILAIYDSDELVGIAPFVKSGWWGLPLIRLSFMGAGVSDYGDIIAAPGRENEVCETINKAIRDLKGWTIIDLKEAREGGLVDMFAAVLTNQLQHSRWNLEPCPCIDLATTGSPDENWSALLKGYSKKTRANISYYDRSLGKTFVVDHAVASDGEQLELALSSLFDLHSRRWNERWLPGVFGSRPVRQFHIEAGKKLLAIDALRLRTITLDGICVAVLYCFGFNGRTCYYQGGFEPQLAKHSLGSVLIARAIHGAIDEHHGVFDFLRGNEDYKRRWTNGQFKVNKRILVSKSSFLLRIAELVHKTEQFVEVTAKKLFAGGLVRKAKKTASIAEE